MTSNTPTSDRVLGSLRSEAGEGITRIEERFDSGIDDLWSALTEPRRLARWYGKVEGDLRVGGELHVLHSGGERTGRIDACEPPQRLLVRLRDTDPQPGQPEEIITEVELTADGGQTILVVEVRGLPLPLLAAYGIGVQIHVEHLTDHISGRESCDTEARWEKLLPSYEILAADIS